jgi:predicted ribosome quality control (RQC) complex YloA/Tae2 family protein
MQEEQFHFNGVNYYIRVGGNSKENDHLVKTSAKTDIWFHVDGTPKVNTRGATPGCSAHVVLLNTEKLNTIPKQVIKRCACLCKSHSSSKSESKCGIIYTALANVLPTEIEGRVTINGTRKIIFI